MGGGLGKQEKDLNKFKDLYTLICEVLNKSQVQLPINAINNNQIINQN